MNWNYIQENFPDAYRLLRVNPRNLFDFFDGKGILISVCPVSNGTWCWMIQDTLLSQNYCSQTHKLKSRPIAEVEAFNKGFDLIQSRAQ